MPALTRLRPLGLALISLLILAASITTAVASDAGPPSAPKPSDRPFDDPEIDAALADARQAEERAAAERMTPEARAKRQASRVAHRSLSATEALELVRAKHGRAFAVEPWKPLDLLPGQSVKEYLGEFQALVNDGDGKKALLESTMPLRARDQAGELKPVSLQLAETSEAFRAVNPLVDVDLPKSSNGWITFREEGFRLRLDSASTGRSGQIADGNVFYANTAADTDSFVRPIPSGIETFLVVRSAEGPERSALEFDLPAGAELKAGAGADRGVTIIDGDKLLGRVEAPSAWDADGMPVPVAYDIEGSRITVRFPHRDGDFRYPLIVDPIVGSTSMDLYNLHTNGTRDTSKNENFTPAWYYSSPGGVFYGYQSVESGNRGLTVYTAPVYLNNDAYGQWVWQAPRPSSFIERADFGYVTTTSYVGAGVCTIEGIYGGGVWQYGTWYESGGRNGSSPTLRSSEACRSDLNGNYKSHCVGTHNPGAGVLASCVPGTANDAVGAQQNLIVFGMVKNGSGTPATWPAVRMEGAAMYLYDNDSPTVPSVTQANAVPSGWVHTANLRTSLGADDKRGASGTTGGGLGIKRFQLWRNNQYVTENVNGCLSDHRQYCPVNWGTTFDYGTDLAGKPVIPEGTNTFTANAIDVLGKGTATNSWTVKVDRSAPGITPSGSLWDARNTSTAPGVYRLDFSIDEPYSGLESVQLYVDDASEPLNGSCGYGAGGTCTFMWDSNERGIGSHTFRIVARDKLAATTAGHESTTQFSVNFAYPADYDECLADTGEYDYCALYDRDAPEGADYPSGTADYDQEANARSGGGSVPSEPELEPAGPLVYDDCYAAYGVLALECTEESLAEETLDSGSGTVLARAASTPPIYGLGNDPLDPPLVDDQAVKDLNVKKLRVILPYNIMQFDGLHDYTGDGVADPADDLFRRWDALFRSGVSQGWEFMVSFSYRDDGTHRDDAGTVGTQSGKSVVRGDQDFIPNPRSYRDWALAFKQRFRSVQRFTAWNEPNHKEQPLRAGRRATGKPFGAGPKKAAYFTFLLQRDVCRAPNCVVVAGDFWAGTRPSTTSKNWASYVDSFRSALAGYDTGADGRPKVPQNWGIHPYWDVRYINGEPAQGTRGAVAPVALESTGTHKFWTQIPAGADVWFTEVGSRRDRCCDANGNVLSYYRNDDASQQEEVSLLLNQLAFINANAERLYYYHWREPNAFKADTIWDSGLVNPDGTLRPAYTTFKNRP